MGKWYNIKNGRTKRLGFDILSLEHNRQKARNYALSGDSSTCSIQHDFEVVWDVG